MTTRIQLEGDARAILETGTVTLRVDRETLRMLTWLTKQYRGVKAYRQLDDDLIAIRDRAGWGPKGDA